MRRSLFGTSGLVALSLIAAVGVATTAMARPHGPWGPGGRLEDKIASLGLDAGTRQAVYAILDNSRAAAREQRQKLRDAHEAMRGFLDQDQPDEAAVMAQAETIGGLETAMQKQRLHTLLQVLAKLTPEQRAKLRERGLGGGGCGRP
jgi:Spy/CpxP family protein refolding chaperone